MKAKSRASISHSSFMLCIHNAQTKYKGAAAVFNRTNMNFQCKLKEAEKTKENANPLMNNNKNMCMCI